MSMTLEAVHNVPLQCQTTSFMLQTQLLPIHPTIYTSTHPPTTYTSAMCTIYIIHGIHIIHDVQDDNMDVMSDTNEPVGSDDVMDEGLDEVPEDFMDVDNGVVDNAMSIISDEEAYDNTMSIVSDTKGAFFHFIQVEITHTHIRTDQHTGVTFSSASSGLQC